MYAFFFYLSFLFLVVSPFFTIAFSFLFYAAGFIEQHSLAQVARLKVEA